MQHGGQLVLEAMKPEIRKIFDMTGCSDFLQYANSYCMKVIRIIAYILLLSVFSLINVVHAQSVTLIPKWTAQAQFAGYYVAEKMGFYKEEGLDVHVKHPSHSENSFQYLKEGEPQAVITNLSQALMEYFAGKRIVNILQTSQENSLMLVSHSPLKGIPSLQHREIAVWNHLTQNYSTESRTNTKLK